MSRADPKEPRVRPVGCVPLAKDPGTGAGHGADVRAAGPKPPVDPGNTGGNNSKPHLNREQGGGRGERLLTSNPVKIFYTICLSNRTCEMCTNYSCLCHVCIFYMQSLTFLLITSHYIH